MTMDRARFRGTLLVLLAALTFSISGLTGKWMPWSGISLAGGRALLSVFFFAAYRRTFRVRMTGSNLLAGVAVALTSTLFMLANKLTTAANAIVLQYAMPAFVILLCAAVLRQRPTKADLLTALFVLCGVVLCFLDNLAGGSLLGNILALCSAVTYAIVFFAARLPGSDPLAYSYLGSLLTAPLALNLFFDPAVCVSDPMPFLVLILMALSLTGGYLLFSVGIRTISPITAAILCNIEPVLNPIWVFLALGETPGATAILGAGVVLITVTVYSVVGCRQKAAIAD